MANPTEVLVDFNIIIYASLAGEKANSHLFEGKANDYLNALQKYIEITGATAKVISCSVHEDQRLQKYSPFVLEKIKRQLAIRNIEIHPPVPINHESVIVSDGGGQDDMESLYAAYKGWMYYSPLSNKEDKERLIQYALNACGLSLQIWDCDDIENALNSINANHAENLSQNLDSSQSEEGFSEPNLAQSEDNPLHLGSRNLSSLSLSFLFILPLLLKLQENIANAVSFFKESAKKNQALQNPVIQNSQFFKLAQEQNISPSLSDFIQEDKRELPALLSQISSEIIIAIDLELPSLRQGIQFLDTNLSFLISSEQQLLSSLVEDPILGNYSPSFSSQGDSLFNIEVVNSSSTQAADKEAWPIFDLTLFEAADEVETDKNFVCFQIGDVTPAVILYQGGTAIEYDNMLVDEVGPDSSSFRECIDRQDGDRPEVEEKLLNNFLPRTRDPQEISPHQSGNRSSGHETISQVNNSVGDNTPPSLTSIISHTPTIPHTPVSSKDNHNTSSNAEITPEYPGATELPEEDRLEPIVIDASGGQHLIDINQSSGHIIIYNFGGVGTGTLSWQATVSEIDTIRFWHTSWTARNLRLMESDNNLTIGFEGYPALEITLVDFSLEDLDNLPAQDNLFMPANLWFGDQPNPQDDFDVSNSDWIGYQVFSPNKVTFLNSQDNYTYGLENSNDTIHGLAGDDVLVGLSGNDTLLGGSGNDLLLGGSGKNSVTGEEGSDIFASDLTGFTFVTDYRPNEDLIGLPSNISFSQLHIEAGQGTSTNNTLISINGIYVLELYGVNPVHLREDHFSHFTL